MSADDLDRLMRKLAPPVEVTPERAARVMDGVLARLDERQAEPGVMARLRDWQIRLAPLPRFAVPMAAAALLGIVVGQGLRPATEVVIMDPLFASTTYSGLGY